MALSKKPCLLLKVLCSVVVMLLGWSTQPPETKKNYLQYVTFCISYPTKSNDTKFEASDKFTMIYNRLKLFTLF